MTFAYEQMIDSHTGLEVDPRETINICVHDVRGIGMAKHVAYTWAHDIVYEYGQLPRSCQRFSLYGKQVPPATTATLWPNGMTPTGMQYRTTHTQKIHALVIVADALNPMSELPELANEIRKLSDVIPPVSVLLDTTMLSSSALNPSTKAARIRHAARIKSAIDTVGAWAERNKFMYSAFDAGHNLDMLNVFFHQVLFQARPFFQAECRERRAVERANQRYHDQCNNRGMCDVVVVAMLRVALVSVGVFALATAVIHAQLWMEQGVALK
jgi:hypothetical protein